MTSDRVNENSLEIRERVIRTREIQTKRFAPGAGIFSNSMMGSQMVKEVCRVNRAGKSLLKTAMEKLGLSARAYDRILKVARTIADIEDSDGIRAEFVSEAIQYRSLDRQLSGQM